jgi:hypothetical protein
MKEYNSSPSGNNPEPDSRSTPESDDCREAGPGERPVDGRPREYGGRRKGLDPTRYGDWEKDGRCIDF